MQLMITARVDGSRDEADFKGLKFTLAPVRHWSSALEDTGFFLGSAVEHPHDLVLGTYSVHTHKHALDRGEAKIAEIGKRLRAEGRL